MKQNLLSFALAEHGAVTIDWVVLTSAGVGLGIAVATVVSQGIEKQSNDINDFVFRNDIVRAGFRIVEDVLGNDFAGGAGGWLGGEVVTLDGFGEVYQIGPYGTAELDLEIPEGTSMATLSFDLIGADDLSGESATITINGEEVAVYTDNHGTITKTETNLEGISVSVNQLYTNEAVGAGDHGSDSRATYTITVNDPGENLVLGVTSSSGQPIEEEFFAIDDVRVRKN